jgi:hypothetical protein
MPAGRPTDYNAAIIGRICAEMALGTSLRTICSAEDMPDRATVYRWLLEHAEFRDLYARAKEDSADSLAEEIQDIADTQVIGEKTKITDKGIETYKGDMIEHRRLQVDARKWIAAKLKPRKYGDRLDLGNADDKPLAIQIVKFSDTTAK